MSHPVGRSVGWSVITSYKVLLSKGRPKTRLESIPSDCSSDDMEVQLYFNFKRSQNKKIMKVMVTKLSWSMFTISILNPRKPTRHMGLEYGGAISPATSATPVSRNECATPVLKSLALPR